MKQSLEEWVSLYADDPFLANDIQHLQEHFEHTRSQILAVGQFSAGKSALLNALLGHIFLHHIVTSRIRIKERRAFKSRKFW